MDYIFYPSARVSISGKHYMDAVDALQGTRSCFCDGETILVPEHESALIALLKSQYGGVVEYGQGKEGEFATKAIAAGLNERLVSIGDSIWEYSGFSVSQMIEEALENPDATDQKWRKIYLEGMNG